jgi:hypothetical protein
MLGPAATWDAIRTGWFRGLTFLKLTLWSLALVSVRLTLRVRRWRTR